ncbi:MAG TPA: hypothetical protein DEB43_03025 [Desulfovibrio sp.]|nr:hypothetical protein [Desulfovibrio sp.]
MRVLPFSYFMRAVFGGGPNVLPEGLACGYVVWRTAARICCLTGALSRLNGAFKRFQFSVETYET